MKNFDTKITLHEISLGHNTKQEYTLGYSADANSRSLDTLINYDKNVTIPVIVPILFHTTGVGYALKNPEDSYVKSDVKELIVIYDTDGEKPLLWIAPKNTRLIINTAELSKDAVLNYDTKGNLEMITDDAVIRVTLRPKSGREKMQKEYGAILYDDEKIGSNKKSNKNTKSDKFAKTYNANNVNN